jgi:hypothetical protein
VANDTDIFGDIGTTKTPDDSAIFKDITNHQPIEPVRIAEPQNAAAPTLSPIQRRMGLGHQGDTAGRIATAVEEAPYNAGGAVADMAAKVLPAEAAGALGYGTNLGLQVAPMMFGGGGVTQSLKPAMQASGKWVMQTALKPTLDALRTGEAAQAIDTMLQGGFNATRGGVQKMQALVDQLSAQAKDAVANSTAMINKGEVGKRLQDTLTTFRNQVNPQADMEAIKQAWLNFRNHPDLIGKTEMPVQQAQALKQGTYNQLAKKYGENGKRRFRSTEGVGERSERRNRQSGAVRSPPERKASRAYQCAASRGTPGIDAGK